MLDGSIIDVLTIHEYILGRWTNLPIKWDHQKNKFFHTVKQPDIDDDEEKLPARYFAHKLFLNPLLVLKIVLTSLQTTVYGFMLLRQLLSKNARALPHVIVIRCVILLIMVFGLSMTLALWKFGEEASSSWNALKQLYSTFCIGTDHKFDYWKYHFFRTYFWI